MKEVMFEAAIFATGLIGLILVLIIVFVFVP